MDNDRRENCVLRRMIVARYSSIEACCRINDLWSTHVYQLVSLNLSPYKKNGEYRKACCELAELLEAPLEKLFPAELYKKFRKRLVTPIDPDYERALEAPADRRTWPDAGLWQNELQRGIESALRTLKKRDQNILRLYYLEDTSMEHIGRRYRCSANCAFRRVESALKKLAQRARTLGLTELRGY
jgi:RNA polymerase sigma factor (sigma-70 family)